MTLPIKTTNEFLLRLKWMRTFSSKSWKDTKEQALSKTGVALQGFASPAISNYFIPRKEPLIQEMDASSFHKIPLSYNSDINDIKRDLVSPFEKEVFICGEYAAYLLHKLPSYECIHLVCTTRPAYIYVCNELQKHPMLYSDVYPLEVSGSLVDILCKSGCNFTAAGVDLDSNELVYHITSRLDYPILFSQPLIDYAKIYNSKLTLTELTNSILDMIQPYWGLCNPATERRTREILRKEVRSFFKNIP